MLKKNLSVFGAAVFAFHAVQAMPVHAEERKPAAMQVISQGDQEALDDGEVGTVQYVAGGLVGTLLGLGIGEGIQGRYMKTGWIVTTGELGSLGMMIAGVSSSTCSTTVNSSGNSASVSCGTSSLTTFGVLAFVGFRVFELIDIWAGPAIQNSRYRRAQERRQDQKVSFLFAPTSAQSAMGGLQFRF